MKGLVSLLLALISFAQINAECVVSLSTKGEWLVAGECYGGVQFDGIDSNCTAETQLALYDSTGTKRIENAKLSKIPGSMFFGVLNKEDPSKTKLVSTGIHFSDEQGKIRFDGVPCFTKEQYDAGG